ncbi:hypothetical protein BJ508DRAFT_302103 [Ascobolus immersus RN42]|uniref:Uncharacterized protein n=1 Tax=Ascobolus immersus RN42 TaxID=1160509 RepID=A0A3N4IKL7_ASCIM|nr:hypothetical protein BJ508DRAFT_302103 [Ascobolus immersus RN42]
MPTVQKKPGACGPGRGLCSLGFFHDLLTRFVDEKYLALIGQGPLSDDALRVWMHNRLLEVPEISNTPQDLEAYEFVHGANSHPLWRFCHLCGSVKHIDAVVFSVETGVYTCVPSSACIFGNGIHCVQEFDVVKANILARPAQKLRNVSLGSIPYPSSTTNFSGHRENRHRRTGDKQHRPYQLPQNYLSIYLKDAGFRRE